MTKIENEKQYEWAVARVEELLPHVNEEHYSLEEPSLIDIIKLRMYEMGLHELTWQN